MVVKTVLVSYAERFDRYDKRCPGVGLRPVGPGLAGRSDHKRKDTEALPWRMEEILDRLQTVSDEALS